jgi:hypothetical protein
MDRLSTARRFAKNVADVFEMGQYRLDTNVTRRMRMAKKVKLQSWTKEDVRTLKTLAREKRKTTVIARTLKRSIGATYQKAMRLGVRLG